MTEYPGSHTFWGEFFPAPSLTSWDKQDHISTLSNPRVRRPGLSIPVDGLAGKKSDPLAARGPLYTLGYLHMGLILTCISPAKTFPLIQHVFEFLYFYFILKIHMNLTLYSIIHLFALIQSCCFALLMNLADPSERGLLCIPV